MSDSVSDDSIELFNAKKLNGAKGKLNSLSYKKMGYQSPFRFKNLKYKQALELALEDLTDENDQPVKIKKP